MTKSSVKLKEVILNGNQISVISESFCELVNLERLSLTRNFLRKLPHAFSALSKPVVGKKIACGR